MKSLGFILTLAMFVSCAEDAPESPSLTYVVPETPEKFPPMTIPDDNPLSEEGIALGRALFYDPVLDKNGERSCASCHRQEYAFSAPHSQPLGVMPHINLAYDRIFLWNGDVEGSLEDVMLFEIEKFFQTDLEKINARPEYQKRFRRVFGVDRADYIHIARALAQYERTLISADSKFDRYMRGETQLTEAEYRGLNLFYSETADCFHCHGTVLFKDNLYHNNGLSDVFEGDDQGRYLITGDPADMGKFKTPTLRNIALTAPYMHDNRYQTLKEVVDFYSDHVKMTEYTDPLMNHEGGINMTEEEKNDLIAFLHTLTDSTFISDPALAAPAQ